MLKDYIVDLNMYEKKTFIGKGASSNVFLVVSKEDIGKKYAGKVSIIDCSSPDNQKLFMSEIEIYSKIKYPTLLGFIGYNIFDWKSQPYPVSIFDYIPNGSLQKFIENCEYEDEYEDEINDTRKYIILLGISFGMKYLHSKEISHRDLKPANILLNEKYYPIICDLGFSKITNNMNSIMSTYLGTTFYMAPEIKRWKNYNKNVDVYSFSIIVSELLANAHIKFTTDHIKGNKCKEFLKKCNSTEPEERPSFDDICRFFVTKSFLINFTNINKDEVKSFFKWLEEEGDPESISFFETFYSELEKDEKTCDMKNDDKKDQYTENSLVFQISERLQTAKVIKSPKATGDVTIPSFITVQSKQYTVTRIDDNAFCNTSITAILFKSDSKVKSFGNFAFSQSSLWRLQIPPILDRLDERWCEGCDSLSQIEDIYKNPFFSIENSFLIEKKENLKEIVFVIPKISGEFSVPQEITCIRSFSFSNQSNLLSVNSNSPMLSLICPHSFYRCKNLKKISFVNIEKLSLGSFCFSETLNLSEAQFTCKELGVGESCFENCKSLSNVLFKDVEELMLNASAFKGCSSLFGVAVSKAKRICIGSECFVGAENLKSIGLVAESVLFNEDFIKNCSSLSFINIRSEDDLIISKNTFEGCSSLNHVILYTTMTLRLCSGCFKDATNMNVFEGSGYIVSVDENCFSNCSSLKSLLIKDFRNLKIEGFQFTECLNLESVVLSSVKSSINLMNDCFNGATNLKKVEISGTDLKIGERCFKTCSSLQSVSLNFKEVAISSELFADCHSLQKIEIKAETKIDLSADAFIGKSSLESVELIGLYVIIRNNCFQDCVSLKKLTIQKAINLTLFSYLFKNCQNLTEIDLGVSSNLTVNQNCFEESSVQTVEIQGDTIEIFDEAFKNCQSFKSFTISSAVIVCIKNRAFENCKQIENVLLNVASNLEIGCYCFSGDLKIKSIKFHGCDVMIGKYSFFNCTALQSVYLETADTAFFDDSSFEGCTALATVVVNATKNLVFGKSCFAKAKCLKYVKSESNEVILCNFCFDGCKFLECISLPIAKQITYIKNTFNKVPQSVKYDFNKNAKIDILDEC